MFKHHEIDDVKKYQDILEIKQEYGYMMALVFGDEQQGIHMTNVVGSSVKTQMNYGKLRTYLKETFPCFVGSIMANELPRYIPYASWKLEYNDRILLIDETREWVRLLKRTFGTSFRMGIG